MRKRSISLRLNDKNKTKSRRQKLKANSAMKSHELDATRIQQEKKEKRKITRTNTFVI